MKEVRALTGIRGIAALIVFLGHTRETLLPYGLKLQVSELPHRLFLSGGRQVDLFFVLSGLILTLVYGTVFDNGLTVRRYFDFLRKRVARIWPLHAFMLMLIAGFVAAAYLSHAVVKHGIDRFEFLPLLQSLLLMQAWFGGAAAGNWNPPSWSVSIEFLAYLVLPAFLLVTARGRKNWPWLLIAISIAIGFTCYHFIYWGGLGIEGITRGLTEFSLGCLVVGIFSSPFAQWCRTEIGSLCALGALLLASALTADTGFQIAVCSVPLLLALSGENRLSAFFGSTPIFFLGEISYSIYLGHFLFTSVAYRLVNPVWMSTNWFTTIVGTLFLLCFVLGLSTLTYYGVERPGREWLAGRRRRGVPAAAMTESKASQAN